MLIVPELCRSVAALTSKTHTPSSSVSPSTGLNERSAAEAVRITPAAGAPSRVTVAVTVFAASPFFRIKPSGGVTDMS
jgi:hypothetical protein